VGLRVPGGPGVRDDSGVYEGWQVPVHYDPLISKLVAWGEDRADAIARLRRAVAEYRVLGIQTTLPFFERVLRHEAFVAGEYDTSFVERHWQPQGAPDEALWPIAVAAAALDAFREQRARRLAPRPTGTASGWKARGWSEFGGRR
jgi:acetyl-CoA carboxylase biotin carboxylase subunit